MGILSSISSIPFYLICIDEVEEANFSGRLYCGIIIEGLKFQGVEELIFSMENIMDKIEFPQSTVNKRAFKEKNGFTKLSADLRQELQKTMRRYNPDNQRGKKATIAAQIQFRQNASWQGMLKWIEQEKAFEFESEFQFMTILDACARG